MNDPEIKLFRHYWNSGNKQFFTVTGKAVWSKKTVSSPWDEVVIRLAKNMAC